MAPVTSIESQIKPGDIVRLKSGGPSMTVVRVVRHVQHKDLQAECYWWAEGIQPWGSSYFKANVPWGKEFPLAGLVKVPAPAKRRLRKGR